VCGIYGPYGSLYSSIQSVQLPQGLLMYTENYFTMFCAKSLAEHELRDTNVFSNVLVQNICPPVSPGGWIERISKLWWND
jgi:hypothetical protein